MIVLRESYLNKLRSQYDSYQIKILKGIRGSGKTVLMHQMIEELSRTVDRNHIIYIDMESSFSKEFSLEKELDVFLATKIQDKSKYYFFIDEAQHLGKSLNVVLRYREETGSSVFLSCSTELILNTSDHTDYTIYPFTYSEYLLAKEDGSLSEYMKWGGLPGRLEYKEDKQISSYLDTVYKNITFKDIFKRKSPAEEYKFNSIASLILGNSGKDFKANFIKDFCNFNKTSDRKILERKTIYNYLDKMEKSFLISRAKRYNTADNTFLSTVEKHWATDIGFRTIKKNFINSGDEYLLKNIVYNELVSRGYEVYTGKTYKGEIDFAVFDSDKKCFIQVISKMTEALTIQQIFDSFSPIKDAAPRYVISMDKFDYTHSGITHINIEDFLLNKKALTLF